METDFEASVLIVDGPSAAMTGMQQGLQGHFGVTLAAGGADARRMLGQAPRPDLIVLGAALPDMDGLALLHELKGSFLDAAIPVIFLVPAGAPELERRACDEGAADVVTLPADPAILLRRVATQLQLARARAMLRDHESRIDSTVAGRTRDALAMHEATILAMALLAEPGAANGAGGVANHLRRTRLYFAALARELRFHPRFGAALAEPALSLMAAAAPLHDIGKARVPGEILDKPGRLTPAEFELMKLHTVHGRDAIAEVEKSFGADTPCLPQFLAYARQIAYSHQEKWDGSGYPQGLAGEAIPLPARLMAVADVYDALISKRVYKPAFTHETALELIRQGRGEHFDPDVVDAMLVIEEKFRAIAQEYRDLD